MSSLYILGGGGHGRVVADTAQACGFQKISFLDAIYSEIDHNGIWPVVGNSVDDIETEQDWQVFLAIGSNPTREKADSSMKYRAMPVLQHPRASVSPHAKLGDGSLIVAGAVVNAFAEIGRCCIVNTSSSIDHDCRLGDYVHVSPGAHLGGDVTIGKRSWVGIGSSIHQGVSIGKDVVIGAGAVVIDNVADGMTVVGVPAKPIEKK